LMPAPNRNSAERFSFPVFHVSRKLDKPGFSARTDK
jgi:hypothetical protein